MNYIQTEIDGVWLIEPRVFSDERGYFMEAYKKEEFEANIGPVNFIQDNESKSSFGVLRGLHYQKGEHSQAKLVRVLKGEVLDVAVDLRKSSPTFGKHVCVLLSEENKRQFFIPRGFAHGFAVLSEEAVFTYKVDNKYAPQPLFYIMTKHWGSTGRWQSRKCYYLRKTERELPLKMPLILNEFLNKQ